jgi:hypothetical protein
VNSNDLPIVIGAGVALVVLVLWVWLLVVPALKSYSGWFQRGLAFVLSIYVLAALLGAGGLVGALVLWNYDRIG